MDWRDVRLCIGLCNNQDKINSVFFWNYQDLVKPRRHMVVRGQASIKSASLNTIVKEAYRMKCDKVLFLDIDQEFPFDTIPKLLTRNLPVVSGLYHLKKEPFSPVAGWKKKIKGKYKYTGSTGEYWKDAYSPMPKTDNDLAEVDWVGAGCLMVDMEVFNKIKFPPFYDTWDNVNGVRQKGHDILFCEAVKKAGYKVYVDTLVQCAHIGQIAVNDLFVDAYMKSGMNEVSIEVLREKARSPQYWDERHFADTVNRTKYQYPREWSYIISQLPKESSVAEVGCGPGWLMERMRDEKGCTCFGYDFSRIAIDDIKQKGFNGECADFRSYKPNGRAFDAVVSSHMLEHMEDDELFLKNLATLLDDSKGKVIVSVPAQNYGLASVLEHQRVYTQDSLKELMKKVFKQVRVKSVTKSDKAGSSEMFVGIGSKPYGI